MVGWGRLGASTAVSQALLRWATSSFFISGVSYSFDKMSPGNARRYKEMCSAQNAFPCTPRYAARFPTMATGCSDARASRAGVGPSEGSRA